MKRALILVAMIAAVAGLAVAQGSKEAGTVKAPNAMQPSPNAMAPSTMAPASNASMSEGARMMSFSTLKDAEMDAANGPTVLYFCSSSNAACSSKLAELQGGRAKLPSNAHILVVDSSNTPDLRMHYNVSMDNTFVQISPSGAAEAIWSGGGVDGVRMHLAHE